MKLKSVRQIGAVNLMIAFIFTVMCGRLSYAQPISHGFIKGQASNFPTHASGPICMDQSVSDSVEVQNLTFLVGNFNFAGSCSGPVVDLDLQTGKVLTKSMESIFNTIDGEVYTTLSDGNGGWYVGGNFSLIDGVMRTGLAHINPDGTLDLAFNAVFDNYQVNSLRLISGKLYVGGSFNLSNGVEAKNLTALNPITGANSAWGAETLGEVYQLTDDGSSIYAVGNFQGAGARTSYSANVLFLDQTTKLPLPDQPVFTNDESDPDYSGVYTDKITTDGAGGFFVTGRFTHVNGVARKGIVYLNSDLSVNTNFVANYDGYLERVFYQDGKLYLVGDFTKINGQNRLGVAALNTADGTLNAFDPCNNRYGGYSKEDITGDGTNIFLTQVFGVGGTCTGGGAMLDTTNGNPIAGTPFINGKILKATTDGSGGWYVYGEFSEVGGLVRNKFAHIQSDGSVGSWNPGVNFEGGPPSFMLYNSGIIYLAGEEFYFANGNRLDGIAAIDTSGNLVAGFIFSVTLGTYTGRVDRMVIVGNIIYLVGLFDEVNSTPRQRIAAVNKLTGSLESFAITNIEDNRSGFNNPEIRVIDTDGTTLFIGGLFDKINNANRTGLAAFDLSGNLQAWAPTIANTWGYPTNEIYSLVVHGSYVALSGNFNRLNGSAQWIVGAVDMSGVRYNWQPGPYTDNNYMYFGIELLSAGGKLFMNGTFTKAGGASRRQFAAFDSSFALTSWEPKVNTPMNTEISFFPMFASATSVLLGGQFSRVGVTHRSGIAQYDSAGAPTGFNPIFTVAEVQMNFTAGPSRIGYANNHLIVAGVFDRASGSARKGFATYDNLLNLTSMNLNIGSPPYGIPNVVDFYVSGGLIYIQGNFTTINGTNRLNQIGAVDFSGNLNSWNITATVNINFISSRSDHFYYRTVDYYNGGVTQTYEMDPTNNLTNWDPISNNVWNTDNQITSVIKSNNSVAIRFDGSVGNYTINRRDSIARFDLNGQLLPFKISVKYLEPVTYRLGMDGAKRVNAIETDGTTVYFSGNFESVNGQSRSFFASTNTTGTLNPLSISFDDSPTAIAKYGSSLFFGGYFTTVQGTNRNSLASTDLSGVLSSWNPDLNWSSPVYDFEKVGSSIYFAGYFTKVGVSDRLNIAAVDDTLGNVLPINPLIGGAGYSIGVYNNRLIAAGSFRTFNSQVRTGLAVLDQHSNLVYWPSQVTGGIHQIEFDGTLFYLAGFNMVDVINDVPLPNLVSLNNDGSLGPWSANANSWNNFSDLKVDNGTVYFVSPGLFEVNGAPWGGVAAVDSAGVHLPFSVPADGSIYNLFIDTNDIYVSGEFYNIGATPRNYIAKFSKAGVLDPWNPNPDGLVSTIFKYGGNLYLLGGFQNIAGQSRPHLASFDGFGNLTSFNPITSSVTFGTPFVSKVGIFGSEAVFHFSTMNQINGVFNSGLFSVDLNTEVLRNWNPEPPFLFRFNDTALDVLFSDLRSDSRNVRSSSAFTCQKAHSKWFCDFRLSYY